MASTDFTLLALAGVGHRGGRAFGFASCNRCVGAAEGMNVLREERVVTGDTENADPNNGSSAGVAYECGVTNVEYTEFQRLGISDQAVAEGSEQSAFPANTNILYVGAPHARRLRALACGRLLWVRCVRGLQGCGRRRTRCGAAWRTAAAPRCRA